MKKYLLFLLCSFFCACTSLYSYTFDLDNEEIVIQTSYSLKETEDGFLIYGSDFSVEGMFIDQTTFNLYYESLLNDESVTIINQTNDSICWKIEEETNYLKQISDTTAVLMGSLDVSPDIYEDFIFDVNTK